MLCFGTVFSQGNDDVPSTQDSVKKVVQFSGIITEGDSLYGISGAAIVSMNSGTGTNSNLMGYFSFPVFEGDSIVVAALGYKKRYFKIPKDTSQSYSLMINMSVDTIELPMVDLRVFPSEEVFTEILLAMDLNSEDDYSNMESNINAQIMSRLMETADLVPRSSYRYYMDQQAIKMQQKYMYTVNPLTDPFAWARVIKDLKESKEKREAQKKQEIIDSRY